MPLDSNELIWRLRRLDSDRDPDALEALAADAALEATAAARTAVEVWLGRDARASQNALVLLSLLGELAAAALLEAPAPPEGRRRIWLLRTVVQADVALREKIVAKLKAALDDRELVQPATPTGPCEEPPRARRVCDEAYVQLRRLLNDGESEEDGIVNASVFLKFEDERKDAEIEKARDSGAFTNFMAPTS